MPTYTLSIQSTFPTIGSVDVPQNTTIAVAFNRDLAPSSVTGNFLVAKIENEVVTNILGTVNYSNKKAEFAPNVSLDPNTTYRVTIVGDTNGTDGITTGIRDIFGNGMLGNYMFTFTTTSAPVMETPVILTPTSNTTIKELPNISWNEVDRALNYEVQLSVTSDFSVDTWENTTTETSVTPDTVLVEGPYFCRLRYTTVDGTSPWSEVVRFYYSTISYASQITTFLDVIETNPEHSSTNNPTNTPLSITFSEEIDSDSVSNIKLIKLPNTTMPITTDVVDNVVSISATLEENSEYIILVKSDIRSIDGSDMSEDYSSYFTTTYTPLYANYNDVYSDIFSLTGQLDPHLIYKSIRDASIYAQELRTQIEVANPTIIPTDWTDIPFYIKQYVRYQAGYDVFLGSYMSRTASLGSMRQLGDLLIQDNVGIDRDVNAILNQLKLRIKPWLDQIMGFGFNRGYAIPKGAVKGENASPYQDFQSTRATFKEY